MLKRTASPASVGFYLVRQSKRAMLPLETEKLKGSPATRGSHRKKGNVSPRKCKIPSEGKEGQEMQTGTTCQRTAGGRNGERKIKFIRSLLALDKSSYEGMRIIR